MLRWTIRIPKHRLHKPSGQAVVTLDGRDIYLGRHGSTESEAEYHRLVAEWQRSARVAPPSLAVSNSIIDEVIVAYLDHVKRYQVKIGQPTSSQEEASRSLGLLHKQYGQVPALEFGPLALKAPLQSMIDQGNWCRTTINKAIAIIKCMFRWAAENDLVSADIYQRLQTVSGLREGRTEARESEPVLLAPEDQVRAVIGARLNADSRHDPNAVLHGHAAG